MDYPKQVDVGRVNLWVKDSKKCYKFLSGVVEFFQADGTLVKLNIRAFRNNKLNERSADFFGSVSIDIDGVAFVEFSEKVEVEPEELPTKRAVGSVKPRVQQSRLESVVTSEVEPLF